MTLVQMCLHAKEDQIFARSLQRVNHMSLVELQDEMLITNVVRDIGLVKDGRPLYGFNGKPGSEEKYMHNVSGVGMFQLPKQVGCMLSKLASLNVDISTFIEIGAFYGWTGLFFTVFLNSVHRSKKLGNPYKSASFDIYDMRKPCVISLMTRYNHDFYVNSFPSKLRKQRRRPILNEDFASASKWYRQQMNRTFASDEKIDLCFIDGEHGYPYVSADVRFFAPLCRFLLFHDIVDADSHGVKKTWGILKKHNKRNNFVYECAQQAGTKRRNFGLGLISALGIDTSHL